MSAPCATTAFAATLAELVELGMGLAREVKEKAAQAEGVKEISEIALAFERVARSVRMTIALQGRLAEMERAAERYERRQGLLDRLDGTRFANGLAQERKERLEAILVRELPKAADAKAAKALRWRLEERIEREALFDGFIDTPIEDCVARIRAGLGLVAKVVGSAGDGARDDAEAQGVDAHVSAPVYARLDPQTPRAVEAGAQRHAADTS